jgi:DNA invertase Pin-like site-specific DNA recombinase
MVAQMERRFIKERQREGIAKAKAEGAYRGGKVRVDYSLARRLHNGGLGVSAIVKSANCSQIQVYRIVRSKSST